MWIFTCRQGFEKDLVEELGRLSKSSSPREIGPALVAVDAQPPRWPVFGRAGFPLTAEVKAEPDDVAAAAAAALGGAGKPRPWILHAWVPDTDRTNELQSLCDSIAARARTRLGETRRNLDLLAVERADDAIRYGGVILDVCVVSGDRVLVGAIPAQESPTLAPGGRERSRMPKESPSRAARKLVEAFTWIRRAPEPGETCVDLGAAPGGWVTVLLEHRARVIAVDPANLAPALRGRKGLVHVKASAFDFAPDEPVDWLCCDMAWRPLEVAALLAKWGRRRWASALVANVKLPMKQRVEFVERVLKIVSEGGWQDVRARQLYHDREEVTLTGWRT
jgi:23S rRNA (cytidine2498-2'-O)-methyltransferase